MKNLIWAIAVSLVLCLSPISVQAQPLPHFTATYSLAANGDPSGICTNEVRFWINSVTNEMFSCYQGTWHSAGGGAPSFPLLAPDGSYVAPSYSFTNDPKAGMHLSGSTPRFGSSDIGNNFAGMTVDPTLATAYVRLSVGSGFPKLDVTTTKISTTLPFYAITGCATALRGYSFDGNDDGGVCAGGNDVIVEQVVDSLTFSRLTLSKPTLGSNILQSNSNNQYVSRLALDADPDGDRDGTFAVISAVDPTGGSSLELVPSQFQFSLDIGTSNSTLLANASSISMYTSINSIADGSGFNATTNGGTGAAVQFAFDATNNSAWTVLPNGIQIDTNGTQPACSVTTVRRHWYQPGGAGVADTYEVCMKSAADTYAWVVIATNP